MLKAIVAICFAAGSLNLTAAQEEQTAADEKKSQSYEVKLEKVVTTEDDGKGEPQTRVTGKIVIVGADGKVKEYALDGDELPRGGVRVIVSGDDKGGETQLEAKSVFVFGTEDGGEVKEQLMIGVHCDVADDVLRSQLKLGDAGLIVLNVIDESPAKETGIVKGDLILSANGGELKTVEQLVEVVQGAGEESIAFAILRDGERVELTVTPKKIKTAQHVVVDGLNSFSFSTDGMQPGAEWLQKLEHMDLPEGALEALKKGQAGVRLRSVHPGIVIDRASGEAEIRALIEEVRSRNLEAQDETKQVQRELAEAREKATAARHEAKVEARKAGEKAQAAVTRLRALRSAESEASASKEDSIAEIQVQMKALQEQLAELQRTLEQLSKSDKQ